MADNRNVSLSPAELNHANKYKRKKKNIHDWKDKKAKTLRQVGKPYVSRKGIPKLGTKLPKQGRVCSDKCTKAGCTLGFDVKKGLQESFYANSSYDQQSEILKGCLSRTDVKRRTTKNETSRRNATFTYVVKVGGENQPVCQKTLCDIYGVTPRRLQILQDKMKHNINTNDNRGKHCSRPHAIKSEIKQIVHEHINSFPMYENHYFRERGDRDRKYLNPSLSLKKMYKLFFIKYPNVVVKDWLYRHVFKSEFKLSFGQPHSDTCKTCDKYFIQLQIHAENQMEMDKLRRESELHHRKADKAYKTLANDTEAARANPNLIVLGGDLQQVLFVPQLTHSTIFYQRQFSCYNYGIHDVSTGKASMMLWHEACGKRGSLEIASCLLKYMKDRFTPVVPGLERKLLLWSDRCVGQNNNWTLIDLFIYLIQKKMFTTIEQKFLCTGHSFMPCDRDFALIESKKRVSKVMVPSQWKEVIEESRPSDPFQAVEMNLDDFKDFGSIQEAHIQPGKLKITSAMWLQLSSDDPTSIKTRSCHNELEPWKSFDLLPSARSGQLRRIQMQRNLLALKNIELKNMYDMPLPTKPKKIDDLKDMCQYMLPENAAFYEGLTSS